MCIATIQRWPTLAWLPVLCASAPILACKSRTVSLDSAGQPSQRRQALLPHSSDDAAPNFAMGFAWQAAIETAFQASRLPAEHTIFLRFMAAYEASFRGVMLTDESGSYHFGLAPYGSLNAPAIEVTVGGVTFTHPLPDPVLTDNDIRAGVPQQSKAKWRELAVTVHERRVSVYLGGSLLGSFEGGNAARTGNLDFGKLRHPEPVHDQFYGLLDDLAIFARGLSEPEIAKLTRKHRLDGTEPGLLAAWTFDGIANQSHLHQPSFKTTGPAQPVQVSADRRDAEDSASLPAPVHSTALSLPFSRGQVWMVTQGQNSSLSHHDIAAFALDFIRIEPGFVSENPRRLPGGSYAASLGQPVLAPADGHMAARLDCFQDDNRGGCEQTPKAAAMGGKQRLGANLVCLEHAASEYSCLLHLRHRSIKPGLGASVVRGQTVGEVGSTGVPSVHLHFALSNLPERSAPGAESELVTIPVAFSDYFVSNDFGQSWHAVKIGTPTPGQWLSVTDPRTL